MSFDEFELLCLVSLNDIVKKEKNRKTLAKMVWKHAERDIDLANYYLFELISDYYCSFKVNDLIQAIKTKQIGWNHNFFESFEKKLKEYDDFLICPPSVDEGVIECRRCGSNKTFSFSKQTRRADESATVFVRCSKCNNTFKM
jgi:DNA-directed RNA polymerase subunit M/transcription elongation factor TFIIS